MIKNTAFLEVGYRLGNIDESFSGLNIDGDDSISCIDSKLSKIKDNIYSIKEIIVSNSDGDCKYIPLDEYLDIVSCKDKSNNNFEVVSQYSKSKFWKNGYKYFVGKFGIARDFEIKSDSFCSNYGCLFGDYFSDNDLVLIAFNHSSGVYKALKLDLYTEFCGVRLVDCKNCFAVSEDENCIKHYFYDGKTISIKEFSEMLKAKLVITGIHHDEDYETIEKYNTIPNW